MVGMKRPISQTGIQAEGSNEAGCSQVPGKDRVSGSLESSIVNDGSQETSGGQSQPLGQPQPPLVSLDLDEEDYHDHSQQARGASTTGSEWNLPNDEQADAYRPETSRRCKVRKQAIETLNLHAQRALDLLNQVLFEIVTASVSGQDVMPHSANMAEFLRSRRIVDRLRQALWDEEDMEGVLQEGPGYAKRRKLAESRV